ncbi:MAG: hypothetical protein KBT04_03860 [Bacteroidales bacterium]|nr:hypothetical protein [Candidatus Colimorpha onthohippi]
MADNIINFNIDFNCNIDALNVITNKFEALFEKCNIGAHIVKDSTVNMGNSVGKVADNMDDFVDKVDFTVADVSDKFKDLDDIVDQFADDTEKVAEKSNGFKGAFDKISNFASGINSMIQLASKAISTMQEFTAANEAQQEAEAKLAQVMRNTMAASDAEIQSIKDLASAQQKLGVIGDEVQLAGAQELGTYLEKADSLKTLMPVIHRHRQRHLRRHRLHTYSGVDSKCHHTHHRALRHPLEQVRWLLRPRHRCVG